MHGQNCHEKAKVRGKCQEKAGKRNRSGEVAFLGHQLLSHTGQSNSLLFALITNSDSVIETKSKPCVY